MRPARLCLAIALVVFATACGKPQQKVPDGPALPLPQCRAGQGAGAQDPAAQDEEKDFARMVSAMDRSGDIRAVTTRFLKNRATVEALLAKRDAELLKRLQPDMDAQFSEARLRTRTACAFMPLVGEAAGIAALETRSRDPRMHAINTAIWTRTPAPAQEGEEQENQEMTPRRKALLRRISEAMALQQMQANIDALERDAAAVLSAALDPASATNQAEKAQSRSAVLPNPESIVDGWLAPALVKIPDDDLAEYLQFAESRFGGSYYVALSAVYDFQAGDWFSQLSDILRPYSVSAAPADLAGKDALIADARRSLREIGTPAAAADAMGKLQAQRLDPNSAEIHTLLGEAAIQTAPPMPLAQDQVRAVIEPPNYADADRNLSKALELAPDDADAQMLLGRLRFLQGNDDEALRLYDLARAHRPDHPSIDYYLGDLLFMKQDYAKAIRYYQASLSKPERIVHTHLNVMRNLLSALRKSGRQNEYPGIAEAYLKRYPEAWNIRFEYAEYLLASNAAADKVLAVIEPIPDALLPVRKVPTLSAALIRKAEERVGKSGPGAESMKHIRRAIQLNPESPALAEAVCRSGVGELVSQHVANSTKDPAGMATALVLCGMRWQRHDTVQLMAQYAQVGRLSQPHPDLYGESPLCYAAATRNVRAFSALAKIQANPAQKCRDGYTVAERIQQMTHRGVKEAERMQTLMNRFYKKS